MAGKTVVVLGGGIGGQVVAGKLAHALRGRDRVVLVDREPRFVFPPSLLWAMVGDRQPRQFTRDLRRLSRKGIEVLTAEVTAIDLNARQVRAGDTSIPYDYLVVALGTTMDLDAVPGQREAAHHPYDLPSALRLRDALAAFRGGRVVVDIVRLPYRCPAAPYETAMLIDAYLRKRGLRAASTIDVYTPEPLPMPSGGRALGFAAASELARCDIGLHFGQNVTAIDPAAKEAAFESGERAPFDLLVAIPPHKPPPVIAGSPLAAPSGWIAVDRNTLATSVPDVFAIGDVTAIPLASGMMLPKAGVFAHNQGEAVAANIVRRINGEPETARFDGNGACFLEVGGGRAGYASGNFYEEPGPHIKLRGPSRLWHLGKVLFEKQWLRRWL